MSKLKLGVIGMSEGNGHPYSWSAIFNGYNPAYMKDCPFPVIPDYLSKQSFPEDSLGHLAIVTHVWCPDKSIATHIAKSSNIDTVVDNIMDMVDAVDAVLLARDDAATHYEYALPFLQSGKHIFIDKPFAIKTEEANKMWAAQQFENQIFTCSSLRFAKDLSLTADEKEKIGTIKIVEGGVMKKWEHMPYMCWSQYWRNCH
jgi:predicted dehydrogenase